MEETEKSIPPLPLDVRDRILSHLLPPAPPLPVELISRTLAARLSFLPPSDADPDSHLTPFSTAGTSVDPSPLSSALERLSGGFHLSDTQYAHDGEATMARFSIEPEAGEGAVLATFEHEEGEQGRGWVYRGAEVAKGASDPFSWKTTVDEVSYPSYGGGGFDSAPEDYWAGFTPPNEHAELPEDSEDAYWAQYDAGEHNDEDEAEESSREDEPVTPPAAAISTPDPAGTLSLLLGGLGKTDDHEVEVEAQSPVRSPQSSREGGILEQKIRGKVRAQLVRAWTAFSEEQDPEGAGFEWLRLGREIADRPSWGAGAGAEHRDERTAVCAARIEAARDMFELVDDGKAFWRLVEEAIRIHTSPVQGGEEVPLF